MKQQLEVFQNNLAQFAAKHKDKISKVSRHHRHCLSCRYTLMSFVLLCDAIIYYYSE